MFTVRHEALDGYCSIFQAEKVMTKPSEMKGNVYPSQVLYEKDGIVSAIDSGDVYVMNESGKTVADFHLENLN